MLKKYCFLLERWWTAERLTSHPKEQCSKEEGETKFWKQPCSLMLLPIKGKEKCPLALLPLASTTMFRFAGYFSVIGKPDVDTEVRRLLLSYMNGIQAVYLLPSLREEIDISIVR